MKTILHVVGARPNFVKTAPIMAAMARRPGSFRQTLLHTGQHYDYNMSQVFFEELEMPAPDVFLEVGSGTHAEQTARVMLAFEPVVRELRPDWVVVVGDVNSTLACALVCAKLGVRVAHVEAGLRSGDRSMPEEINRLVTDQIADLLLTPSRDGDRNLEREGVSPAKIRFVGNVMIDTLVRMLPTAQRRMDPGSLGAQPAGYVLATLHRPSNVDDPATLVELLTGLCELAADLPVIFPVHPRTRQRIANLGMYERCEELRLVEPLGYLDFLALMSRAALVVTDSGGVQEETTYLGVPCLTVRSSTERPVTVELGTNWLVPSTRAALVLAACNALRNPRSGTIPEGWDGRAAERIAALLESW